MLVQRVSFRYARAALQTAINSGISETVYNDFQYIGKIFKLSRELKNIITNPIVHHKMKKDAFTAVFGDGKISKLSLEFLSLLIDKRRGDLVPNIVEQYENQYNHHNNRLPATILSAIEMNENAQKEIVANLTAWTKKTILPEFKIDNNIIGGIKVTIEDWIYDASIENQLKVLYYKLVEG